MFRKFPDNLKVKATSSPLGTLNKAKTTLSLLKTLNTIA